MRLPSGFKAAGIRAGLKRSGRHDLGLLLGDAPLAWAMTGTTNALKAACVTRNRARFTAGGAVRGLVINSGNANCATGEAGVRDNARYAELAAAALGVGAKELLTASTGVVGQPLDVDKIAAALPELRASLSDEVGAFAKAILTTDLVEKSCALELPGGARVVGVAKGSGMIHPKMATMLAFVTTDAEVEQAELRQLWSRVVARSFNQVTVDGDTSPNDMAFAFASGRVACERAALEQGLEEVSVTLARQIARDGEGASKLLTVTVAGAASDEDARLAARAVARSPLTKAAIHGNDPNWGRILNAVGYSGAEVEVGRVRITLQGVTVYHGAPQPFDAAQLSAAMRAEEVVIAIDLALAEGSGAAWGCDLTEGYVRINADYTT